MYKLLITNFQWCDCYSFIFSYIAPNHNSGFLKELYFIGSLSLLSAKDAAIIKKKTLNQMIPYEQALAPKVSWSAYPVLTICIIKKKVLSLILKVEIVSESKVLEWNYYTRPWTWGDDFKFNPGFIRKPVEISQYGRNVLSLSSPRQCSCSSVG